MPPNEYSIVYVVCSDTRLMKTMRNITRPPPSHISFCFESNTENGNGRKYTYTHAIKERLHSMVTWKTLNGKNHRSPQDSKLALCKRIQQGAKRQRPRAYNLCMPAVTTEIALYLPFSLSHSLYTVVTTIITTLHTDTTSIHKCLP